MLVKHRPRVVRKDFVANKYNPSQPRDAKGRWGSGGGGGGTKVKRVDQYSSAEDWVNAENPEVLIRVDESSSMIDLEYIEAERKGEGLGTKAMEDLTLYADVKGKTLGTVPDASFGTSEKVLRKFYRKSGFRMAPDKISMYRKPQQIKPVANVSKRKAPNPLRIDPTRTKMLRKRFEVEINRRYRRLRREINDLVLGEDALGLAANYNPSQPRDAKGRWGSGGGGGGATSWSLRDHNLSEEDEARAREELMGDTEVSISGDSYYGEEESVDYLFQQGMELNPDSSPGVVRQVAEDMAKKMHRAPDSHWESGRGKTLTHNHPTGSAALSRNDIEAARERGFSKMVIVSQKSQEVLVVVPPTKGWPDTLQLARWDSLVSHDKILEDAGCELSRFEVGSTFVVHARWAFRSDTKKLKAFKVWLTMKFGKLLAEDEKDAYWDQYIEEGWKQGLGRAYADARPQLRWEAGEGDFYRGSKRQFMETAFATPVSRERVKLLAERAYTDLKGVTSDMGTRMARVLTDGMIQGKSPRVVARDLDKELEIGRKRSLVIARTETVRAHNEGQLDAMELLGVEEVGVAVEWSTSGIGTTARGNPSPCPICAPLAKMVLTLREAHGILPRHANCMCSWIPANVGEDTEEQIRAKSEISKAIDRSIKAEAPKKRTLAEQRKRTRWGGADKVIRKKRPKELEPTE